VRHARIALVVVAAGVVELAYGWRIALMGAAPDLLFIVAAVCALEVRPATRAPLACGIGLWSDFIVGGRLGLMALGYGIGAKMVEALMPAGGSWGGRQWRRALSRAGGVLVAVLVGTLAAHLVVALAGALVGAAPVGVGVRLARAAGIAAYTCALAPVGWPLVSLCVGRADGGRLRRTGLLET
jgi:hypothetical protein